MAKSPNVKSFQKPGLCRRFCDLINNNLQVGENDGNFFIVRPPTPLTNPNKSHLKKYYGKKQKASHN
jgi:hypothetical protein